MTFSNGPHLRAVIVALTMVLTGFSNASAALVFDFSFATVYGQTGTVTGQIFGLVDNAANQAATDIIITGNTTGLSGFSATPFDLFSGLTIQQNAFTVAAGTITSAHFVEAYGNNCPALMLNDFMGSNRLGNASCGQAWNQSGFAGVTFTAESTSVPEPISAALLVSGLAGLAWVRRRA